MRTYYLYTLNDPTTNTPKYVGITCQPNTRYQEHLDDDADTKKTRWIAQLKAGGNIPTLNIVATTKNVNEVCQWEIDYIKKYQEIYNLTNSTKGGEYLGIGRPIDVYDMEGNFIKSSTSMVEFCEDMHWNVTHSGQIAAVCLHKRNYAYDHIFRYVGEPLTKEQLEIAQASYKKRHEDTTVYILDLTGQIVGKYKSCGEAGKTGLYGKRHSLSCALQGKYTHVNGYLICKDPKEYPEKLLKYKKAKSYYRVPNPINQYDLNGHFIAQFWTYSDAAKQFDTNVINLIRDCCNGKYKQSKGYIWKFAKDENDRNDIAV